MRTRELGWSFSAQAILLVGSASAQVTQRVSVATAGTQANNDCYLPVISADGRYVAFDSGATTLVPPDANPLFEDIFLRDRQTGTTELVSVSTGGVQANSHCYSPAISSDGRYVAFTSIANNLVPGDTNSRYDIFVRDRQSGTTERVSVGPGGVQGNQDSMVPSISEDGRYVAFESRATNLVAGDTNAAPDVFVHDRLAGITERVSVDSTGAQASGGGSGSASISADGRFVAFVSDTTNLVPGDTNGTLDVFVRDRSNATTERVSVDSSGLEANDRSEFFPRSISADGRYVVFYSLATNLVPGDTNGVEDTFLRDRLTGTTERISLSSSGTQGDNLSLWGAISASGRYVAFWSAATNLVTGDTNLAPDVFVRDRSTGTTERVSLGVAGTEADDPSDYPGISADGRFVSFSSLATNLVPGDTNAGTDVFVHDRAATGFASLCDPGVGGVIACPCANPPSGPGRGCDNSAGTAGAILSASGIAYLSTDSLVFTTSGEKPTATSVLLQGTSSPAAGVVYGQGVRCVGGTLKRLFTKSAVGGSITAPNFGAGDPTVSARSAAKGNPIPAGQSRWYLVFYRDPLVLGGCPSSSTFNATQTGVVAWSL